MKIPADAEILDPKLTKYFLIFKSRNDKSQFLAQAGFTEKNPETLKAAIRSLVSSIEAVEDGENEYGQFYRVDGDLDGVNQTTLSVATIWIQRKIDNKFQFVTLKPLREPHSNA
ncbi:MAG: hypothetical protein IGS48_11265 [Oscillatoriales cyanobacterium C42_A2020_001]|nr:hypothetical protein [Leptolyngbyaceae cyanobacterium C42_A2020_001]